MWAELAGRAWGRGGAQGRVFVQSCSTSVLSSVAYGHGEKEYLTFHMITPAPDNTGKDMSLSVEVKEVRRKRPFPFPNDEEAGPRGEAAMFVGANKCCRRHNDVRQFAPFQDTKAETKTTHTQTHTHTHTTK